MLPENASMYTMGAKIWEKSNSLKYFFKNVNVQKGTKIVKKFTVKSSHNMGGNDIIVVLLGGGECPKMTSL